MLGVKMRRKRELQGISKATLLGMYVTYHSVFLKSPLLIANFNVGEFRVWYLHLLECLDRTEFAQGLVDKLLEFEVFSGTKTRSETIPPQSEYCTKVQSLSAIRLATLFNGFSLYIRMSELHTALYSRLTGLYFHQCELVSCQKGVIVKTKKKLKNIIARQPKRRSWSSMMAMPSDVSIVFLSSFMALSSSKWWKERLNNRKIRFSSSLEPISIQAKRNLVLNISMANMLPSC
jgi:hypothetical protein